jgi:hypothetical protein
MRCPVRPAAVAAVLRRHGLSIAEYKENCVVAGSENEPPFGLARLDAKRPVPEKVLRRLIKRFPTELGDDVDAIIEEMCVEQMQSLAPRPFAVEAAMNHGPNSDD